MKVVLLTPCKVGDSGLEGISLISAFDSVRATSFPIEHVFDVAMWVRFDGGEAGPYQFTLWFCDEDGNELGTFGVWDVANQYSDASPWPSWRKVQTVKVPVSQPGLYSLQLRIGSQILADSPLAFR